jgi:Xaa-Pro aminopeptidase
MERMNRRSFLIAGSTQSVLLGAASAVAMRAETSPVPLQPNRLPREEFTRRHDQVRAGMKWVGLDVLLIPINENMTYLSNISTIAYGAYLLFYQASPPTLLVNPVCYWDSDAAGPARSQYSGNELGTTIRETSVVSDIRGVQPMDFGREIARCCRDRSPSARRLGIVGRDFDFPRGGGSLAGITGPQALNAAVAADLRKALPEIELVDATFILEGVRLHKSPEEIVSIRNAAALADRCKAAIAEELRRPGCRDADIFAAYWDTLLRAGGSGSWWFMTASCASAAPEKQNFRDAPTGRSVERGDVILAEIMPAGPDGFVGHAEACFALGRPAQAAHYERVNKACMASFEATLSRLRPGVRITELADAADRPVREAGMKRGAPIAYGLGLFGLEPPMVGLLDPAPGPDPVLAEHMVMCVISHVFDPATHVTVRTGSTQLITSSGTECLNTEKPTGLLVL